MESKAKLEQYRLVLDVLIQMKDCLDRGETYTTVLDKSFNLTRSLGICWHVYVHTPPAEITGIGSDYLEPAFIALGLDREYPVESQIVSDTTPRILHFTQRNLYDPDHECGKLRIKLVDDLIQYFEQKLSQ